MSFHPSSWGLAKRKGSSPLSPHLQQVATPADLYTSKIVSGCPANDRPHRWAVARQENGGEACFGVSAVLKASAPDVAHAESTKPSSSIIQNCLRCIRRAGQKNPLAVTKQATSLPNLASARGSLPGCARHNSHEPLAD